MRIEVPELLGVCSRECRSRTNIAHLCFAISSRLIDDHDCIDNCVQIWTAVIIYVAKVRYVDLFRCGYDAKSPGEAHHRSPRYRIIWSRGGITRRQLGVLSLYGTVYRSCTRGGVNTSVQTADTFLVCKEPLQRFMVSEDCKALELYVWMM